MFRVDYVLLYGLDKQNIFVNQYFVILEAHVRKDLVMMLRTYLTLTISILLLLHVFMTIRSIIQALKISTSVCVCFQVAIQPKSFSVI